VHDSDTTPDISISVSDNGAPSLSATQHFAVIVNPLATPALSSASSTGGNVTLDVHGDTGPDYAVQVSTNMLDWHTIFVTNPPAMPFQWTAENDGLPMQFYRIRVGPPLD
jgi:hypothetical protein